jgi:mRNA interferase MazF
MSLQQFQVYLVRLDPTIGTEIQKTRPCVIISPNEMNGFLQTVIIAPLTTKTRDYPTRVNCFFENKLAQVVLDQIRTVDRQRLIKPLGFVNRKTQRLILETLQTMFSE